MICESTAMKYCSEDISKIENYDEALLDNKQVWHCHHRLEVTPNRIRHRDKLISDGLYYNRPASELIFLTPREHVILHCSPVGYYEYKPVAQYQWGNCIAIHLNPYRAALASGGNHRCITKCCDRLQYTHFGFTWKWV